MVAGRCVVLLNINGRCSATLTGRLAARAPSAASSASARTKQLAAEAAADEGRDETDVLLRHSERLGHVFAGPSRSFGSRSRRVSLSPSQAAIEACGSIIACAWSGSRVGRIELSPEPRECAREIADCAVGRSAESCRGLAAPSQSSPGRTRPSRADIVHPHQLGGSARLLERLRDNDGDRPGGSARCPGPASSFAVFRLALSSLPAFSRGDDGEHAGSRPGAGQVDRSDATLGNGRADDIAIGLVGERHRAVRRRTARCRWSSAGRRSDRSVCRRP